MLDANGEMLQVGDVVRGFGLHNAGQHFTIRKIGPKWMYADRHYPQQDNVRMTGTYIVKVEV